MISMMLGKRTCTSTSRLRSWFECAVHIIAGVAYLAVGGLLCHEEQIKYTIIYTTTYHSMLYYTIIYYTIQVCSPPSFEPEAEARNCASQAFASWQGTYSGHQTANRGVDSDQNILTVLGPV